MLQHFGEGRYSSYAVSEKVIADATAFRRRSILTLRRFGEGPYSCSPTSSTTVSRRRSETSRFSSVNYKI